MRRDKLAYYTADLIEDPYLTEVEIRRLMRWMTPGSPIWKAAQALVTRSFSDLDSPEFYLKVLVSPYGRRSSDRLVAVDALRLADLTPEQAELGEAVFCRIVANKQAPRVVRLFLRTLNMLRRLAGATLLASFAVAILVAILNVITGIQIVGLLYTGLCLIALGALLFGLVAVPIWSFKHDAKRELRLRKLSTLALEWGGPGCIDTLALAAYKPELMQVARPALWNVLTRLKPSDYGKVSSTALEKLMALPFFTYINGEQKGIWVHLILDTLGIVGTGACATFVEALAGENGFKPEWREHAQRILPILIERKRLERDSSRLLRPTIGSETVDSLLRPATTSGGQSEDNLLRSAQDINVMH